MCLIFLSQQRQILCICTPRKYTMFLTFQSGFCKGFCTYLLILFDGRLLMEVISYRYQTYIMCIQIQLWSGRFLDRVSGCHSRSSQEKVEAMSGIMKWALMMHLKPKSFPGQLLLV